MLSFYSAFHEFGRTLENIYYTQCLVSEGIAALSTYLIPRVNIIYNERNILLDLPYNTHPGLLLHRIGLLRLSLTAGENIHRQYIVRDFEYGILKYEKSYSISRHGEDGHIIP